MYKNPLRDRIIFDDSVTSNGLSSILYNIMYLLYYFGTHGLAIYFFLTTRHNPGYVTDTMTEAERKEREMGHIDHQFSGDTVSLEDDEEYIGFASPVKHGEVQKRSVGEAKQKKSIKDYRQVDTLDFTAIDDEELSGKQPSLLNQNSDLVVTKSEDNTGVESIEYGKYFLYSC